MEADSQLSLFGLTSSRAASRDRANHSRSQGSSKESTTSGTSGLISHASSAKSDPVGYWLRTYLASELSRLTLCSKTWKNSGTPLGRSWWVLTTLEPRTGESESGLWPTATAGDSGMSGSAVYSTESGRHAGTTLTDAANNLWASPQARDWKDSGPTQGNRKSPNLGTQAHTAGLLAQGNRSTNGKRPDWPTPRANRHGAPDSHGKSPIRGALNPAWVTQLMGYPDGWLDTPPPTAEKPSKPSGTRSYRKSLK